MAKLSDLQRLLPEAGDMTPARARVLVSFARKAGHFTTGGRGPNAPDMTPRDAATAFLLALQFAAPSEAVEEMARLRDLPLWLVAVDPGDGAFREVEPRPFFDHAEAEDRPPRIGPDSTLGEALAAFFTAEDGAAYRFARFDRITLEQSGASRAVVLEIAQEKWDASGWPVDGARAWRLTFSGDLHGIAGCTTTRRIFSEHLQAFADAVAGAAE